MHSGTGESKVQVECDAGSAGHIRISAQSLSVTVGQLILRDGALEMWDSLVVSCGEDEDGGLRVRITAFHPDWDGAAGNRVRPVAPERLRDHDVDLRSRF
jgi:hypothetical protein